MTEEKSNNTDRVSVIVPVYNVENYLSSSVNSIQSQTYKHLEIILIDDGSTDNSKKICDGLAKKDARIRVLYQENSGASLTRNRGIAESTGDYIMFMDADDDLSPYAVEYLHKAITQYNADIAIGDVTVEQNDNNYDWSIPNLGMSTIISKEHAYNRLATYVWWGPCAKLYKADFLKNFRFPKETLSEDFLLMVQMFHQAKISYLPHPIYAYHKREGSLSTSGFSTRSFDEVINTYNAWQYSKQHVPFFSCYALKFFTESCVKVATNAAATKNEMSATSWREVKKLITKHIFHILFNKRCHFTLKIRVLGILLGRLFTNSLTKTLK